MSDFSIVILNTKEKKSNTVIFSVCRKKKTFKPIISHPSNSYLKIRSKWRIVTGRRDLRLLSLETRRRSVSQFSRSVISNSYWRHGTQHSRLPHPSTPGACSNACPSSWWCHPTISSSVIPFSSPPAFNLSQHQGLSAGGSFTTAPPRKPECNHHNLEVKF